MTMTKDNQNSAAWARAGKRPEYEPKSPVERLGYLIEECSEVLVAAGKAVRWGYDGYNPELPEDKRDTNAEWLKRELDDLDEAIRRVRQDLKPKKTCQKCHGRGLQECPDPQCGEPGYGHYCGAGQCNACGGHGVVLDVPGTKEGEG